VTKSIRTYFVTKKNFIHLCILSKCFPLSRAHFLVTKANEIVTKNVLLKVKVRQDQASESPFYLLFCHFHFIKYDKTVRNEPQCFLLFGRFQRDVFLNHLENIPDNQLFVYTDSLPFVVFERNIFLFWRPCFFCRLSSCLHTFGAGSWTI